MTAKEIAELMRLKGWSQAQLARELDISESSISRWFSGKQNPTGPTRILLREWLARAKGEKETAVPA